jgi:Family of unknown function (DUF6325)
MSLGPIELLIIKFPGNRFTGEITRALRALVENGTIRVIDLIFAIKTSDGTLRVLELADLDEESVSALDPLVDEVMGLLAPDDVNWLADKLETGYSAGAMLFENVWATHFADAIIAAHGEVVLNERIPRRVIDQLVATAAGEAALQPIAP